jgi:hypothetical protein
MGGLFAFLFNIFFLDFFERSVLDQILLQGFLTGALGYCFFWSWQFWDARQDSRNRPGQGFQSLWARTTLKKIFKTHWAGLVFAFVFFGVYFALGMFFNRPGIAQVDNFFEADTQNWIERIAGVAGYAEVMRAPHPFAYLLLRPLGWIFNWIFFEPYITAAFLTAAAASGAVFLVYLFTHLRTKNSSYALLMAGLLGLSTSNLVYGSVVESYIFAGATLLAFYTFLQYRNESDRPLMLLSLMAFGITITNFAQTWLGYIISRPKWKDIFRFTGLVISLGIILTVIQTAWYPSSEIFFLLSGSEEETRFLFSVFAEPSWKIFGRFMLLTRTMLLYSVVAPLPFVIVARPGTFPYFQFFQKSDGMFLYADYGGGGQIIVLIWLALLGFAGIAFITRSIRLKRFDISLSLVLCLAFNFLLHFKYGDEPILYSAHWTYALVLLVSIGFESWAHHRKLQGVLLLFLIGLMINQWQFIHFVITTMAAHLASG